MTAVEYLVDTPLANAVGWTLFHSLWQGALSALVLLAILFAIRSPRARYACACLVMLSALLTGRGKEYCSGARTFLPACPQLTGRRFSGEVWSSRC